MIQGCPGNDKVKQPYPEELPCPGCGFVLEMWTDEVKAHCPRCNTLITRKAAPSCIFWCKFAKECVGEGLYNKYMESKGSA